MIVYENVLEKIQTELRRKRVRPKFVYFSPSTDIFQPVDFVLELAYGIFAFLLSVDIGVAFITKGTIPDKHMALFEAHPQRVRAQIGLITLSAEIAALFEPHCAPIDVRLRQIAKLNKSGIETEVRLDPILPGITDDEDQLKALLEALHQAGVKEITLNMLYLRPALVEVLRRKIPDADMRERLLRRYDHGVKIRTSGGKFSQTALPSAERAEIFGRVIRLAAEQGIKCRGCGCMNPDLFTGHCSLSNWAPTPAETGQMQLF